MSSGSTFQTWHLLPPALASPQTPTWRNFKLLLCGIPNPSIASSLPLTTFCTCSSPFIAGAAIAVFKNKISKNRGEKKRPLYVYLGRSCFKNMQAAKTELKKNYLFLCQNSLVCFKHITANLKIIESIDKPLASSSEPRHATLLFPKEIQGKLVKLRL